MAGIRSELNHGSCLSSAVLKKLNQEPCLSSAVLKKLNEVQASSFTEACRERAKKLDVPDDILQILRTYFSWETIEEIDNLERYYLRVLWERRDDDLSADTVKMKELSSILTEEYDKCRKACDANVQKAAQPYEELVDQLPYIKNDPSYKELTTRSERFSIKQALRDVDDQKGQIPTPQQSLSSHLEVLRGKLEKIDRKEFEEAGVRIANVDHLLWRVNRLLRVLESVEKKFSYLNMVKEMERTRGSTA